jgi:hypothetical protein
MHNLICAGDIAQWNALEAIEMNSKTNLTITLRIRSPASGKILGKPE